MDLGSPDDISELNR